jgi:hypothetical protein
VGETIATDPVTASYLVHNYGPSTVQTVTYAAAAAGAVLVLIVGGVWRRSKFGRASDSA